MIQYNERNAKVNLRLLDHVKDRSRVVKVLNIHHNLLLTVMCFHQLHLA